MRNKGKASLLILIVLILLSLGLSGGIYYLLQQERSEKDNLHKELEKVKIEQTEAQGRLDEAYKKIDTLESQLKEAKAETAKLSLSLEEEKSVGKQAAARAEQIIAQLDEAQKAKAYLEKMFYEASDELSKMQAQARDTESKRAALEKKVKELEAKAQKVELGKIVVSPDQAAGQGAATMQAVPKQSSALPGLEGKVLVINKDYNFVVTNLGKKDGIDVGDMFSVYHDSDYLGDVKIEKIHDSMSAAGFISDGVKEKVNEGDKVIQKAK